MKTVDNDGLTYDQNLADSLPKGEGSDIKPISAKNQAEPQEETSGGHTGIIYKSLEEVFHDSMIPYTEHVVLDRALPRVEDGLKPVQRRILYSMMELGLYPDKPYRKSARIVGDCMGKYHPHGDSSVYDAMVRMSQDFVLRGTLIDGHGNFGSVDGDSAAAMRYTEARMTPLALELLRDLDKGTVKWSLNFDDTLKEPDILPGRFPNLLVNGASGIAVGVATNIPPHNLGEVIDGVVAYIDNPNISLEKMMTIIKAPDFPTGGELILGDGLEAAYRTGKGKITIRAKVGIETSGDKTSLIITELPYQVNKAQLLQKIAELKEQNKDKLSVISEIRDESDRKGMRAVIRLKKESNPKKVLEFLFKSTNLQVGFTFNMVAIAGGKPKLMSLMDIISYYTEYQREVIVRRTKFDLNIAKERAHIVEGLLIAIKNIDEVIKIIKKSANVTEAKTKLKSRFGLSDKQAQAILDMRLARLVNLEVEKLEQELKELKERIEELTKILNSKTLQLEVIKREILEIKKKYGDPRRSKIIKGEEIKLSEIKDEPIAVHNYVIGLTAGNTIKRATVKNYAMSNKELTPDSTVSDVLVQLVQAKTTDTVLIFTNIGNCIKVPVEKIKECKWREAGVSLLSIESGIQTYEKPVKLLIVKDAKEVLFYTKKGMVKKAAMKDVLVSKSLYQVIKLGEGDEVINVEYDLQSSSILMLTKFGLSLNYEKSEIPVQGRITGGVRGINLEEKDEVIFAGQITQGNKVIVASNGGAIKKMDVSVFSISPRYRKGLRYITFGTKSKEVAFAKIMEDSSILAVDFGIKILPLDTKKLKESDRLNGGDELIKRKFLNIY